jgi:hypothetical protein
MDRRERGRGRHGRVHRGTNKQWVTNYSSTSRIIYGSIAKFETRDIKWAPDGKGLVLLDKEMFSCAFEVEDGTES